MFEKLLVSFGETNPMTTMGILFLGVGLIGLIRIGLPTEFHRVYVMILISILLGVILLIPFVIHYFFYKKERRIVKDGMDYILS